MKLSQTSFKSSAAILVPASLLLVLIVIVSCSKSIPSTEPLAAQTVSATDTTTKPAPLTTEN